MAGVSLNASGSSQRGSFVALPSRGLRTVDDVNVDAPCDRTSGRLPERGTDGLRGVGVAEVDDPVGLAAVEAAAIGGEDLRVPRRPLRRQLHFDQRRVVPCAECDAVRPVPTDRRRVVRPRCHANPATAYRADAAETAISCRVVCENRFRPPRPRTSDVAHTTEPPGSAECRAADLPGDLHPRHPPLRLPDLHRPIPPFTAPSSHRTVSTFEIRTIRTTTTPTHPARSSTHSATRPLPRQRSPRSPRQLVHLLPPHHRSSTLAPLL